MSTRHTRAPRRRIIGANWEAQQPRRGRPPTMTPRKATRIYQTSLHRQHWLTLANALAPLGAARIDVAALAIDLLDRSLDDIRNGLTGADQVLPVGVVDLRSLYFLLDLHPPIGDASQYNITMLTETREKISIMTIRLQSIFRATWSQVFGLAMALLFQRLTDRRGRLTIVDQIENFESLRQAVLQPRQLEFGGGSTPNHDL